MDLFKRIQDLSAVYDDDGPSATVLESRPMFNDGGMLVQPSDDGSRPGYKESKYKQITELSDFKKMQMGNNMKKGDKLQENTMHKQSYTR